MSNCAARLRFLLEAAEARRTIGIDLRIVAADPDRSCLDIIRILQVLAVDLGMTVADGMGAGVAFMRMGQPLTVAQFDAALAA